MVVFIFTLIDIFYAVLDIAFNKTNKKMHLTKKVGKD